MNTPSNGTFDSLHLYLRTIGEFNLLTKEEEQELATLIQKGDKRAQDKMIKANLRLVVKIAKDFEGSGLPLLDLINEGNLGLMRGVEKYRPGTGAKFATYGGWWIKQYMRRAIANQSRTIRLPIHVLGQVDKIRFTRNSLKEEFDREPTDEEIGVELGITPSKVTFLRTAAIYPDSLQESIDDDSLSTLADVIKDEEAELPDEQTGKAETINLLKMLMRKMDPREMEILHHRFGLNGDSENLQEIDDSEKTLQEIGKKLGITRERVRQIQNCALKKLREAIRLYEASGRKAKI
jgi:RNA polymerase primary sigma factor